MRQDLDGMTRDELYDLQAELYRKVQSSPRGPARDSLSALMRRVMSRLAVS